MHALREGLARAASAPAVLVGAIAVLWWLKGVADPRSSIAGFVLWAFLSGGMLDRYARQRPLRARGFFAACGGHFFAMLRLGAIVVLLNAVVHVALAAHVGSPPVMVLAIVLLSAIAVVTIFGQIRLVVEDRRSAIGALLAGGRFVRRHPASIGLYVVFMTLVAVVVWATSTPVADPDSWTAMAWVTARFALMSYVVLALYAAGIALFQSRLAHAGYAAAPPLEWPESPAAEAIANAARLTP